MTSAGAAARNSIGLVLVGGLAIGTLFTLFVLPSIYVLLAKEHRAEEFNAEVDELDEDGLDAEPALVNQT